jgi:hypothetical protein
MYTTKIFFLILYIEATVMSVWVVPGNNVIKSLVMDVYRFIEDHLLGHPN